MPLSGSWKVLLMCRFGGSQPDNVVLREFWTVCFGHNHLSAFPRHTSLPHPPSFVTFKKINSNKTLQDSCAAKTFLEFCAGAAHRGCTASSLSSSQLLAGGIVSPVPLRYWDSVCLRLAVTNSEFSVQLLCCVQKTFSPSPSATSGSYALSAPLPQ